MQVMKRSSKYAKKGQTVQEAASMNKEKLLAMCETQVVPAIDKLLESFPDIKRVVVQLDGAGGHGGGRGDMKQMLEQLNRTAGGRKKQVRLSSRCVLSTHFHSQSNSKNSPRGRRI
jgi:hypothetical protein